MEQQKDGLECSQAYKVSELTETDNPTLFQAMLDYIANPLDQRTVKQFSEENGITDRAYYRFQKANLNALNRAINARRETFLPKMRSQAYKCLAARIGRSDAALKLFFQLTGDLVEKHETKYSLMTPDEKRERARALMDSLIKQSNDKE